MRGVRPFRVSKIRGLWAVEMRPWGSSPGWHQYGFETAADACNFVYKNWPWAL